MIVAIPVNLEKLQRLRSLFTTKKKARRLLGRLPPRDYLEKSDSSTLRILDQQTKLDPVRGPSQMEKNTRLEHYQTGSFDLAKTLTKTIT